MTKNVIFPKINKGREGNIFGNVKTTYKYSIYANAVCSSLYLLSFLSLHAISTAIFRNRFLSNFSQ